MAPPVCLRGPPELYLDHPISTIITHEENPPLGKGHSSSSTPPLNPCLEFFSKAITYSDKSQQNPPMHQPQKDLTEYEAESWKHDPRTTLRLIFCQRMVGRPNKEAFYKCLLWVHKNHPRTLAFNMKIFGELGWFKDLLEVLYRVLQKSIDEAKKKSRNEAKKKSRDEAKKKEEEEEERRKEYGKKRSNEWQKPRNRYWSNYDESDVEEEKEEIKTITDVRIARAKNAVDRYQNDLEYRFLHDRVSEVFVEMLTSDVLSLESGEIEHISTASKFCPSIDSSYDRATLICENIARRMFPRHNFGEYKDVEEAHYAYRVRNRLRKQVLSPLRKALERLPAAKQNKKSSSLFKNRKRLIALEIYSKIIGCGGGGRDERRLQIKGYMKLVDILLPKKNIVDICFGDGLKPPHHVVALLEKEHGGDDEIAEVQWRRLVQEFSNKGKLRNCIAVCDVQESMRGTLKEMVCISMGLLVSELSEKPWQGSVIPLSDFPRLHKVEGDNLQSKYEFMRNIECAEKVDFSKIYNRVLQIAITEKLSNAKMPKSIFVFTYKEFDKASKNDWVLDYKDAWNNYKKRGYATVPQLVFWNLKDSIAALEVIGSPVKNHNAGIIITGFSNTLLSLFFKGETNSRTYAARVDQVHDGIDVLSGLRLTPNAEDVMKWGVSTEELRSLFILD
ncbi:unnamed protein product [Prunus armeniaca]|uniref:Uncharacterized protein n=1 Tax=Prunus armeniaca TaxID=36596 RepID=A0A6J5Y455_PRUAR|nr:unnamed protein product [Prunus armeniaca]